MVVYHGTRDDIKSFDLDHPNRKDVGWLGRGIYTSSSADQAGDYAEVKRGAAGPAADLMVGWMVGRIAGWSGKPCQCSMFGGTRLRRHALFRTQCGVNRRTWRSVRWSISRWHPVATRSTR